jgi:hypothetical protein
MPYADLEREIKSWDHAFDSVFGESGIPWRARMVANRYLAAMALLDENVLRGHCSYSEFMRMHIEDVRFAVIGF